MLQKTHSGKAARSVHLDHLTIKYMDTAVHQAFWCGPAVMVITMTNVEK